MGVLLAKGFAPADFTGTGLVTGVGAGKVALDGPSHRPRPQCGEGRAMGTLLEDLFAVQDDIETFALLILVHTEANEGFGDVEQDEGPDTAVDQRCGDPLALDPELHKPAWAATW